MASVSKELSELEIKTLENIGRNVRYTRRNLLGVTLAEMASNTGVSRDVICRLEYLANGLKSTDTVYPSISTVIKFCNGVGVTPAELFDKDFREDNEVQDKIVEHCKYFTEDKNAISLDDEE